MFFCRNPKGERPHFLNLVNQWVLFQTKIPIKNYTYISYNLLISIISKLHVTTKRHTKPIKPQIIRKRPPRKTQKPTITAKKRKIENLIKFYKVMTKPRLLIYTALQSVFTSC